MHKDKTVYTCTQTDVHTLRNTHIKLQEKPSAYKTDTVLYYHIDYKMQPDFEMLKMRREESAS